jgi:N-methylhydantoinase A
LLKVGPRSAGADPGPACYDRGNDEPTVSDANVVLQTLNPAQLLGGRMHIRPDLARAAIDRIAARLEIDALTAAQGIIAVVTANMARAIRVISVQRGHDPRDYTLVAFGGAGPLHAARLAAELDIHRVLVPRNPGILCAMGLLLADLRADFAATRLMALSSPVIGEIEAIVADLQRRCAAWFADAGIETKDRRVGLSVDMRYAGQNYELSIPLAAGPVTRVTIDELAAGFAAAHQRLYGFVAKDEPIQLVTLRAEATGIVRKAELRPTADAGPDARAAEFGRRNVWLRETGAFVSCPLYDRDRLCAGNHIEGPAIVEQMDATTLIVPGATATVDRYLNLLLELP